VSVPSKGIVKLYTIDKYVLDDAVRHFSIRKVSISVKGVPARGMFIAAFASVVNRGSAGMSPSRVAAASFASCAISLVVALSFASSLFFFSSYETVRLAQCIPLYSFFQLRGGTGKSHALPQGSD
jgi:hypothetical protein